MDPAGFPCLCDGLGDPPANARFVDVAPGQLLELSDAHSGRIKNEQREPVTRGEEAVDGEHVRGGRRIDLSTVLPRQLDGSIANRVRLDACEVQRLRERRKGLPDRFPG